MVRVLNGKQQKVSFASISRDTFTIKDIVEFMKSPRMPENQALEVGQERGRLLSWNYAPELSTELGLDVATTATTISTKVASRGHCFFGCVNRLNLTTAREAGKTSIWGSEAGQLNSDQCPLEPQGLFAGLAGPSLFIFF